MLSRENAIVLEIVDGMLVFHVQPHLVEPVTLVTAQMLMSGLLRQTNRHRWQAVYVFYRRRSCQQLLSMWKYYDPFVIVLDFLPFSEPT